MEIKWVEALRGGICPFCKKDPKTQKEEPSFTFPKGADFYCNHCDFFLRKNESEVEV